MVRRVGELLRLQAGGSALLVGDALLAHHTAIQEVARIDLYARLIGEDIQSYRNRPKIEYFSHFGVWRSW